MPKNAHAYTHVCAHMKKNGDTYKDTRKSTLKHTHTYSLFTLYTHRTHVHTLNARTHYPHTYRHTLHIHTDIHIH
jgi:hypothetical protein